MTDSTRLAALEAVAEAARSLVDSTGTTTMALFWAFEALDALPAPTPVETVTLGLWEHEDGMAAWYRAGSEADLRPAPDWRRVGTATLAVTP